MSSARIVEFSAGVLVLVATAAATWHWARADLKQCVIDETLQPIAALSAENDKIRQSVVKEDGITSESAILSSYLERIRNDGVQKYSGLRQKIDRLVNNNTLMVAWLSKYGPHARSSAFRVAAGQFTDYAASFRDRWASVFEIFMAGGNLPAQEAQPPANFRALVQEEIAQAD
jgi:hypothetical protein